MSLVFIVYLLGILESVDKALGVFAAVSLCLVGLGGFFCMLMAYDLEKETMDSCKSWGKRILITGFFSVVLAVLVPPKEVGYAMLAAYGVEEIITNERVQELGGKSVDVIEKALDEFLQEEEDND